jgi:type IV pilus assembly protein PilP
MSPCVQKSVLRRTCLLLPLMAVSVVMLGACADRHDELQQWMEQQRHDVKPHVTPLVAPRKFDPQPYVSAQSVDPFSSQKLAVAVKREQRAANSLLAPELNRRKEPLEGYPIDALTVVGSLFQGGQRVALVNVSGQIYQVRVGDYVGLNYGKVIRITETEIAMREIVQDAVGEWVERTSNLQLVERSQEKGR